MEKIWFALGEEFAQRNHAVTHVSRKFPGLAAEETIGGVHHVRTSGFDTPRSWRCFRQIDVLWPVRLLLDFIYSILVRVRLPEADVVVTNSFWLPILIRPGAKCGRLYVHIQRHPKAQVRWYAHAGRLQTVSSSLARALSVMLPECANHIRVIANPVPGDIGWIDEGEMEKRANTRERIVLYVGRIHPAKGLELLCEAFARFQKRPDNADWSLRLVGPSESALGGGGNGFQERLEELARSLGIPVTFVGFVRSPSALHEEYSRAQIFVYPTLDEFGEASPVAPLEAMSCGCPVITSQLECFHDYLIAEQTGYTFDHRSRTAASKLADQMQRLANDSDLRRTVAVRAWRGTRGLTLANIASQYLTDFEELTKSKETKS